MELVICNYITIDFNNLDDELKLVVLNAEIELAVANERYEDCIVLQEHIRRLETQKKESVL